MRLTPAEGGWRVVVVDGAEDMNRNAANALLKMLEEPPPRAVLLLVCAAPGRLLPTIRSRCRRLRLLAAGDAAMDRLLGALSAGAWRGASAAGSPRWPRARPGRALLLAEEEGLRARGAWWTRCWRAARAAPLRGLRGRRRARRAATTAFSTFMDLLRDRARRRGARGGAGPRGAEQSRLVALRPLAAWGDVWHALTRLQDETERFNLDKRQAIVSGLGMLCRTCTEHR